MNHLAKVRQANAIAESTAAPPEPRLVKAAHEFEAAMMKELLSPLQPGKDSMDGEDAGVGSGSALSSFAGEALGKAISDHGGFGVATGIIRQLSHQEGLRDSTSGSSQGNRFGNSGGIRERTELP